MFGFLTNRPSTEQSLQLGSKTANFQLSVIVPINLNVRISVKVIPNSSKADIVGWLAKQLKVKLVAPAEKGKANVALVNLLSKVLGLPSTSIKILSGHNNQLKILRFENIESDALYFKIDEYLSSCDKKSLDL